MTKNLFVVIAILSSAILPIFIEAQGFTGYPAVDVPPPMKEEWKVDLSNVPKAPIVAKNKVGEDCPAKDPFCNWSCTNCVNNKTDYIQCPDKIVWGITYDDGPSEYTPKILDYLKEKNVKATFFIVGSRVTENPEILNRTYNEGHQIGVHTWSHTSLTTQTNEEIIAEIKWTEQIIKQVTGATPNFMRPPYGDVDDRVRSVLTLLGYKVAIWDLDTDDWKSTDPGFVPESITAKFTEWVKDTNATTGHISLEHDLYPISSKMAPPSLDIVLGAKFQVEQVAKCVSESPYREFTGFPGDNSTSPSPAISSTSAIWGITYDDGPSEYTPKILDYLKEKNVKATFFIVGSRVTENPEILNRTYNEGHQIGVHTWSHTSLTTQTNEEIIAEIKWTEQIIKQVTGATPNFMRPPYGDVDDRVRSVLTLLGYKVAIWDLDTDDWKSTDPGFVPESITAKFTEWVKDTNATTGHISLEHDLYPISSKMAPPSLDIVLGAKFQVEQVAKCVSESPYREFTGFPGDNSTSPSPAISSTSASVAMTPTTTLNNN
ncbi:5791_t:CDS:2 [Entrophospora sp. SA101]|nr:5791_t:CDS:2 [Entrophospora sp. SA101]